MPTKPRKIVTAITIDKSLLARAIKRATAKHGERGFSKYVCALIGSDLAK